jgi:hypothetical protein
MQLVKTKPTLSPAREALRAAIAASAVVDPRGQKIEEAVRLAEGRVKAAQRELDSILAIDRANAERYFDGATTGARPDPNFVARSEAGRDLRQAEEALALHRTIHQEHQRAMADKHAAAQRAAGEVPGLVLAVLCEECEDLVHLLAARLKAAEHVAVLVQGLHFRLKELADAGRPGGYRMSERLRDLISEAQKGRLVALRGMDSFDETVRAAIKRWAQAETAVAGDPAADISTIIEPKKEQ